MKNEYKLENQTCKCFVVYILLYSNTFYAVLQKLQTQKLVFYNLRELKITLYRYVENKH